MHSNTVMVNSKSDLYQILSKPDAIIADVILLGEERALIEYSEKPKSTLINKPTYLGSFVLGYSRYLMYEKFVELITQEQWSQQGLSLIRPLERPSGIVELKTILSRMYYYKDTDSMWIPSSLRYAFSNIGGDLGQFKDESEEGGKRVVRAFFAGKKLYCVIYIRKDNSLEVKITSKGFPGDYLTVNDFINVSANPDYSRTVELNDRIKKTGKNADEFFKVKSYNMTRTFNKTKSTARCFVNEQLEIAIDGNCSLPWGNVLVGDRDEKEEHEPLPVRAMAETRWDDFLAEEIQLEQSEHSSPDSNEFDDFIDNGGEEGVSEEMLRDVERVEEAEKRRAETERRKRSREVLEEEEEDEELMERIMREEDKRRERFWFADDEAGEK
jgi:hypothetical protein